ncbi:hypothetical protein PMAYCL1PPCAC_22202, partial [Pristionchus mayeri]
VSRAKSPDVFMAHLQFLVIFCIASLVIGMPKQPDYFDWELELMSDADREDAMKFDPEDSSWENWKSEHRFCGKRLSDMIKTACSVCPDNHLKNPKTDHKPTPAHTCCKQKCSFYDIVDFCCGGYE